MAFSYQTTLDLIASNPELQEQLKKFTIDSGQNFLNGSDITNPLEKAADVSNILPSLQTDASSLINANPSSISTNINGLDLSINTDASGLISGTPEIIQLNGNYNPDFDWVYVNYQAQHSIDDSIISTASILKNTIDVSDSAINLLNESIAAAGLAANIATKAVAKMALNVENTLTYSVASALEIPQIAVQDGIKGGINYQKELMKEEVKKATAEANEYKRQNRQEYRLERLMKQANDKVYEWTNAANNALTLAKDKMDMVTAYVSTGYEWMEKQINIVNSQVEHYFHEPIKEAVGKFNYEKEMIAYNIGYDAGSWSFYLVRKASVIYAKKLAKTVNAKIQTAKTLANMLKAEAIMKIKALLGK